MNNVTTAMRERWQSKLTAIIAADDKGYIALTEWGSDFIDSITSQLDQCKDLTFKQSACLSNIYAKIS